jgi:hypothetical protein
VSKTVIALLLSVALAPAVWAQDQPYTGVGIGIYPTGTETGFGFRSAKNKHYTIDVRVTKANLFTNPEGGTIINEASWLYKIAYYERVRLHAGMGLRADWNLDKTAAHRYGFVTPLGIEAFPFPFQNAGLFFEAAPFCTWNNERNTNLGVRTVAGFVFYFVRKQKG